MGDNEPRYDALLGGMFGVWRGSFYFVSFIVFMYQRHRRMLFDGSIYMYLPWTTVSDD